MWMNRSFKATGKTHPVNVNKLLSKEEFYKNYQTSLPKQLRKHCHSKSYGRRCSVFQTSAPSVWNVSCWLKRPFSLAHSCSEWHACHHKWDMHDFMIKLQKSYSKQIKKIWLFTFEYFKFCSNYLKQNYPLQTTYCMHSSAKKLQNFLCRSL